MNWLRLSIISMFIVREESGNDTGSFVAHVDTASIDDFDRDGFTTEDGDCDDSQSALNPSVAVNLWGK